MDTPPDRCAAFFHANGFPAGVYRRLFEELAPQLNIMAPPVIDAPTMFTGKRRWQGLQEAAQHWLDTEATSCRVLIGHSMGGYLALMAAAAKPQRYDHVVLIDAPLITGWRSLLLRGVRRAGMAEKVGPAVVAARRRDEWPDIHQARAFFASKPFVQAWAPGVLHSFLREGLRVESDGRVRLVIDRDAERDIYAYLAHQEAWASFKRLRAKKVMVSMVAGAQSEEMRLAGAQRVRRLFGPHWRTVQAGHLLPFEKPVETAHSIIDLLASDQDILLATQKTAPCSP